MACKKPVIFPHQPSHFFASRFFLCALDLWNKFHENVRICGQVSERSTPFESVEKHTDLRPKKILGIGKQGSRLRVHLFSPAWSSFSTTIVTFRIVKIWFAPRKLQWLSLWLAIGNQSNRPNKKIFLKQKIRQSKTNQKAGSCRQPR